jgi:hypothetical protein
MAKKLTSQILNRMIMEAIEEGGVSGFSYDPSAYERGRGAPFTKKGPKSGGAQSDLEQLLNMIQLSNKVPQDIKDFAMEVIMPSADYGNLPTVKLDDVTAKTPFAGAWDQDDIPTAQLPSPQATQGPTKGKMPPAPQMSKPGLFGRLKKAVGLEEQKKIESLVMEVLEEMAKKQKPTKETKKEPKKAGKK